MSRVKTDPVTKRFAGWGAMMESDVRYYTRRAAAETLAAQRALTPEARARRVMLAESYREKLRALTA